MKPNVSPWLILAIFGVLAVAAAIYEPGHGKTSVTGAPDLKLVFKANSNTSEAKRDAAALALTLTELANLIEWDGQASKPRLTTSAQIEDLRITMRSYRFLGRQLSVTYPELGTAFERHAGPLVGEDAGPLSTEQRGKWVECFRLFAAGCKAAS